jgi:hypothetical protein
MPRRVDPTAHDPLLGRQRTAHLIKRLRRLKKVSTVLKSRIEYAAEQNDPSGNGGAPPERRKRPRPR